MSVMNSSSNNHSARLDTPSIVGTLPASPTQRQLASLLPVTPARIPTSMPYTNSDSRGPAASPRTNGSPSISRRKPAGALPSSRSAPNLATPVASTSAFYVYLPRSRSLKSLNSAIVTSYQQHSGLREVPVNIVPAAGRAAPSPPAKDVSDTTHETCVSSMLVAEVTKSHLRPRMRSGGTPATSKHNRENTVHASPSRLPTPSKTLSSSNRAHQGSLLPSLLASSPEIAEPLAPAASISSSPRSGILAPTPFRKRKEASSPSPSPRRKRYLVIPSGALRQALAHQQVSSNHRLPFPARIHALAASKRLSSAVVHLIDESQPMMLPIARDLLRTPIPAVFPRAGDMRAPADEREEVLGIDMFMAASGYDLAAIKRFACEMELRAHSGAAEDFVAEQTRVIDKELEASTSAEEQAAILSVRDATVQFAQLAWDYTRELSKEQTADRQWSLRWFLVHEHRTRRESLSHSKARLRVVREGITILREIRARYTSTPDSSLALSDESDMTADESRFSNSETNVVSADDSAAGDSKSNSPNQMLLEEDEVNDEAEDSMELDD